MALKTRKFVSLDNERMVHDGTHEARLSDLASSLFEFFGHDVKKRPVYDAVFSSGWENLKILNDLRFPVTASQAITTGEWDSLSSGHRKELDEMIKKVTKHYPSHALVYETLIKEWFFKKDKSANVKHHFILGRMNEPDVSIYILKFLESNSGNALKGVWRRSYGLMSSARSQLRGMCVLPIGW